jgi:poly(hydroxyalkanoate) granule-associated protein
MNPQEVWLAGLSALHQAQAQGQKAVQELVAQGEALQSQAQHQWQEIAQRVSNPFAAAPTVSRLEGIFEHRVAQALQAIGVPTAQEVNALREDIALLKAQLADLPSAPKKTRASAKSAPSVKGKMKAKKASAPRTPSRSASRATSRS